MRETHQEQGDPTGSDAPTFRLKPEALQVVYQEACKSHGAITDFRARLLAFLPLASGSGVFILLGTLDNQKLLAPIGLFGVAVTIGLFVYELRGIEDCTMLRKRAAEMELRLGIPEKESVFYEQNWRRGKFLFLDEVGASWIVYTAVLFSWVYLAGVGFQAAWGTWPRPWLWVLAIVYLGVLILALGPGHGLWLYRAPADERSGADGK